MAKITGVVITYNEQAKIANCLNSLKGVVDELVVLDSFSDDQTTQIAASLGAKVYKSKFKGHIEQKNMALEYATTDYVLSLDADELLSDELITELRSIKPTLSKDAYSFKRKNFFKGKWVRYSGWYPDRKIRLFKKSKGFWGGVNPHDEVLMQSSSAIENIDADILHYSFDSKEAHQKQIEFFTTSAAQHLFDQNKSFHFLKPYLSALATFLRMYVFNVGFLDGCLGIYLARSSAQASFLKYKKLEKLYKK